MMLNADVSKGEGVGQMQKPADSGEGAGKGVFLQTFFMDDPQGQQLMKLTQN